MGLKTRDNKIILVFHSLNIYYLTYLVAIKKRGKDNILRSHEVPDPLLDAMLTSCSQDSMLLCETHCTDEVHRG